MEWHHFKAVISANLMETEIGIYNVTCDLMQKERKIVSMIK
jgi:hypothetical protein